jgi:glycosyltransferase involved in cell wall biosynthesis
MKLLVVNMTLDPRTGGGSAARALQATRALAMQGVDCTIATTAVGSLTHTQLRGIRIVKLPSIGGRFRVSWTGFAALRSAVADADVLMLVNHWTIINVLAWRAAVRAGTPYVVCPAGALPSAGRSRLLKVIYNALCGRRLVREASAHIAITSDEIAHYAEYGVRAEHVTIIPNGMPHVPPGIGETFRQQHHLGDAPIALFLGRLAPLKGPDLLIDAFARAAADLPDWRLVIAGPDDGMLSQLRAQAAAVGMTDRVTFTGFLETAAKADALAAADLLVVPSRREAMSIVVLEAAAAARPVLITDRCGIPDVAESGGGWIVDASADGLAGGLIAAARHRGALRAMGERWQRVATERFSWARIAALHVDLLSAAAARAGRR